MLVGAGGNKTDRLKTPMHKVQLIAVDEDELNCKTI